MFVTLWVYMLGVEPIVLIDAFTYCRKIVCDPMADGYVGLGFLFIL